MASVKVVCRRDKQRDDGLFPIYVRLTHLRKIKYLSTGYWVDLNKKEWSDIKDRFLTSFKNSKRANSEIDYLERKVTDIKIKLNEGKIRWNEVNLQTIQSKNTGIDFFEFTEQQINYLLSKQKIRTAQRYKTIASKLSKYIKSDYLDFGDINVNFLQKYESYLAGLGNKTNTIHTNLKTIRTIIYAAIKQDLLPADKNPFLKHSLSLERTEKVRLNSEEITEIENLGLTERDGKLYHTRNAYLFSLYCAGIRVGDLLQLTPTNINGELLNYKMDKTEKERTIAMHRKAQEILKLYDLSDSGKPIFPFLTKADLKAPKQKLLRRISSSNAYMNKCCKQLAKRINTDKPITMHTARHGFAELARKKKVDLYSISKALGHSSLSITERYLASFDIDTLEETVNTVFGD